METKIIIEGNGIFDFGDETFTIPDGEYTIEKIADILNKRYPNLNMRTSTIDGESCLKLSNCVAI